MGTHFKGAAAEVRALDAYIKIVRCSATVAATIDTHLRDRGFTENQFGVLEALLHLGPLALCDIGRKLLTSRPNVTVVVDQLEKRDLVRRVPSTRDRRSISVHLTPRGRRLIEMEFPSHAAAIAQALSPLSSTEQAELGRLCRKLGLRVASARALVPDARSIRQTGER